MKSATDGELAITRGSWVKVICGASNQDIPSISDLCAVYGAAGVQCIDVAADSGVISAAKKGLDWVEAKYGIRPWLMISVSDGKDNHFRKARFDPKRCPIDCTRPCERICPTEAISKVGVDLSRCYGCGRCLSACPLDLIDEKYKLLTNNEITSLISSASPDAVEIHTAPGRRKSFEEILKALKIAKVNLKRIAVSCGAEAHGIKTEALSQLLWERHNSLKQNKLKPIWQLDGRPMSGDLGPGTGRIAISLWEKIHDMAPPGPLQLAGGTNEETIKHLPNGRGPAGIAFGGVARKIIKPWLEEAQSRNISLRDWPEGWQEALQTANQLVEPWLSRKPKNLQDC